MIGHAKIRGCDRLRRPRRLPGLIIGAIMDAPLINRMRNEIIEMGMEPERLYEP